MACILNAFQALLIFLPGYSPLLLGHILLLEGSASDLDVDLFIHLLIH